MLNPLSLITSNPLYLAIAAAVIFAIGFGSGWAINGWRMGVRLEQCNTRVTALADQVGILAGSLERQSESILAAGKGGAAAAAAADKLLEEARRQNRKLEDGQKRLEAAIRDPAGGKRADGKAKDCGDARGELRALREAKTEKGR